KVYRLSLIRELIKLFEREETSASYYLPRLLMVSYLIQTAALTSPNVYLIKQQL
ncbi:unnamed protein product, partial [marine sediment metagenome]